MFVLSLYPVPVATGRDRENQAATGLGASLGVLQTCERRDTFSKPVPVNVGVVGRLGQGQGKGEVVPD